MPEPPDSPELPDDPVLPDDPELPRDPELDDPALLDDPELPDDAEPLENPELLEPEPDEPLELLPDEDEPPAVVPLDVWCVAPGRTKTITPAPTRPAAPTVAVAARILACPRRRAAAADRRFGSEFIGFPS